MTHFEVQTRIGNDWENVWTDDDQPTTFPTHAHALIGIAHLLDEMPDYDPNDYRVVEVAQ